MARGFKVEPEPIVDGLEFYLDAFRELSSCRPGGLDLQPIPFTAIAEYSRIYDIGGLDEFSSVIRKMDDAVLSFERESRKTSEKKPSASAKGSKTHKN